MIRNDKTEKLELISNLMPAACLNSWDRAVLFGAALASRLKLEFWCYGPILVFYRFYIGVQLLKSLCSSLTCLI